MIPALDRLNAWLALQIDYPDRHISEHRDTYVSLFDLRVIAAELTAALARAEQAERERDAALDCARAAEEELIRSRWDNDTLTAQVLAAREVER